MNIKRLAIATVALWVFFFIFDWILHGHLLMPLYEKTSTVWRSHEEMRSFFPLSLLILLLISLAVALLFAGWYQGTGIEEGLRYGFYLGLLFAVLGYSWYPYLPIPQELALGWAGGGFVKGIGSGLILGAVYRR